MDIIYMMILITKKDIDKMSMELRNELMQIMFHNDQNDEIVNSYKEVELEELEELEEYDKLLSQSPEIDLTPYDKILNSSPDNDLQFYDKSNNSKSKKVVEISHEQAQALLANLSEKSINTLKHFTSGDAVVLNELIGDNKTYGSFNELKRSFVGPVNRRLRTVIKDRSAVLFKKIDEDEFSVKEGTANALKYAFKQMDKKNNA